MDLHGLVRGVINSVNPDEPVTIKISIGYDVAADGKQVPAYENAGQALLGAGFLTISMTTGISPNAPIMAQEQPLTYNDLRQVDSLNLNGTRRKFYLYGTTDAVVRSLKKGGDLIIRQDGSIWLVAYVFEQWPDWCAVAATLQNPAPPPSPPPPPPPPPMPFLGAGFLTVSLTTHG